MTIREGRWPPQSADTGYVDMPGGKKTNSHAPYERAGQVAAEVDARLALCGQDGFMLEDHFTWGKEYGDIARQWHLDSREVYDRMMSALYFCCGWKRKRDSYDDFKRKRRFRVKKKVTVAETKPVTSGHA